MLRFLSKRYSHRGKKTKLGSSCDQEQREEVTKAPQDREQEEGCDRLVLTEATFRHRMHFAPEGFFFLLCPQAPDVGGGACPSPRPALASAPAPSPAPAPVQAQAPVQAPPPPDPRAELRSVFLEQKKKNLGESRKAPRNMLHCRVEMLDRINYNLQLAVSSQMVKYWRVAQLSRHKTSDLVTVPSSPIESITAE